MLPADTFWQQHSSLFGVVFPVAIVVIILWLVWRRREKIKEWPAAKSAKSFSPFTRKFLLFLFLFGLLVFATSWAIDLGAFNFKAGSLDFSSVRWLQPDWLNSHAYISNILAGVTGFCIGAPFALVILASFTTEREEKATLDRVNRLSALAWDSFRDLVRAFTASERYEIIANEARDVEKWYGEAGSAINLYIGHAREAVEKWDLGTSTANDTAALTKHFESFKNIEQNFRTAINAVTNMFNFQTEDDWAQIVGSWRVLDQYVRLQRLEQGLEWFPATPDSGFRKWMSRDGSPMQALQDAVDIRLYTPNTTFNVDTMRNALDTFAAYCRMDDPTHLGQYLLHTGNIFTSDRFNDYHAKRDAAQMFILDLQRYVGLVEIEYWPRAQTAAKHRITEPEMTAHEWIGSLQTPEGQERFEEQLKEYISQQKWERRKQLVNRVLWGVSATKDSQAKSPAA